MIAVIKALGGLLIMVSGYYLSRKVITGDDALIQRLRSFEELFKAIGSRIENYCMPTDEILADLPAKIFFGCGYDPSLYPFTIDKLISECPFSDDAEMYTLLEKFFLSLGTSYKSEEVMRCKLACDDIDSIIKRRCTENIRRHKTVPVLSFCISLVIIILTF